MLKSVSRMLRGRPKEIPSPLPQKHQEEVEHWAAIEVQARQGARLFWTSHPRVAQHLHEKALLNGETWRHWVVKQLGRRAGVALELGCGNGAALVETFQAKTAVNLVGLDLEESRFQPGRDQIEAAGGKVGFIAADVNEVRLEESRY